MAKKNKSIKSELVKFWFRLTNKLKYFEYKLHLNDEVVSKKYTVDFQNKTDAISKIISNPPSEINFKHSGHLGDLVYALPILKELSSKTKCNLYIHLNQIIGRNYFKHPTGNVMITERSYQMAFSFLKAQSYINDVRKWNNEKIDIDLDIFRQLPVAMEFHSVRWYYHLTGLQPDMNLPFLEVEPHSIIKNKIVVVRTFRGRNPLINYSFLKQYKDLLFVGTRAEYEEFSKEVPNIDFYDVPNFMEMAQIIKSSRFFVSNQTFSFAIAEGLKVNRLLEANPFLPAVFPIGGEGYDFYFQEQFEKLFSNFNSKFQ
ncbi:hypothetical protein [Flavobacterium hibisci]|uniref:hypothetical protein n=1 Tax=Flavobacterium hibisci TaxID=1914462 RepID=UPI001CBB2C60|nr:hypothetical protein [Flavobacterium hibisci]MBZ4042885.1 hypothetical protein [Flavobacterium hibisci]